METARTTDYDPRYDRAQTIDGAKARYVELESYTLANLEVDVERILREGEEPDRPDRPNLKGHRTFGT